MVAILRGVQIRIVIWLLIAGTFVFSGRVAQAQDSAAPEIVTTASLDGRTVGVRFNERLDPNSATNPANYRVSGGAVVSKATLRPDGSSMELVVSGLAGPSYTLTVNGVQDLSHNAATRSVDGLVQGLISEAIGQPVQAGSTFSCAPGSIEVKAGAGNIWTNADAFHFVRHVRTGDFDMAVQVARLSRVNQYTRGGLMVREDLTPGSRNFFVGTYPAGGINRWVSTVRFGTGGATTLAPGNSYVLRSPGFAYPNVWFRLKRVANTFTAYCGTNGVDWLQLGDQLTSVPPYPATVYLGVATTPSGSTVGRAATAQYLNFADWTELLGAERKSLRSRPAAATGLIPKAADESSSIVLTSNPSIAARRLIPAPATSGNHIP